MLICKTQKQFDAAVLPLRPALLRASLRLVGPNDADDILQEALLDAWEEIDHFNASSGIAGFTAWMLSFLEHRAARKLREKAASPEILVDPLDLLFTLDRLPAPPQLASDDWTAFCDLLDARLLRVRLTALQEHCVKAWRDGMSLEAIGIYLGITKQAVWKHIRLAVAKLREDEEEAAQPEDWVWRLLDWASQVATYEKPQGCWDRHGSSEQIRVRARRFANKDEAQRKGGRA